jgi:hypothetical protein
MLFVIVRQLIECQEVITEVETLEFCRAYLQDDLQEMIAAYKLQNKEIPFGKSLIGDRASLHKNRDRSEINSLESEYS